MPTPTTDSFTTGFRYGPFTVTRSRNVPELACRLIELRHEPSGAKILHIPADDTENLFCLSFQTIPPSSNGIAHVLEHLVLCGSQHFPVRDPFFSMSRRSMNTFMNALTGTDFTCYPAASQIEQDFYNLLDVYIDAVFFPTLDPMSFLQEAHRLEFAERGNSRSPLVINGVVYNEMKGALVQPMRRLMKEMYAALFPKTSYGFDAGGDPNEIPTLTIDELRQFHATYYHPSRCLYFFYGSLPLARHLDVLEQKILHSAQQLPPMPPVTPEPRLPHPVTQEIDYPIAPGDPVDHTSTIALGWLTTSIHNQLDCLALSVLDIILLETDASLLKYRLLQSGRCRQVVSALDTEIPQVPFVILMTGCNREDAEPLTDIIISTLQELISTGIPLEKIDHALHQLELAKSEIGSDNGPFGLTLYSRAALLAHHGEDPMQGLEIHGLFDLLRQAVATEPRFFAQLIQRYLLDTTHRVRLVMVPNALLDSQDHAKEQEQLSARRASLDDAACRRIAEQADQLAAFQEEEQDLSCLPTLHLSDVPKECRHIRLAQERLGQADLFTHTAFTNDIVYLDIAAPMPQISGDDLWLVRLWTGLIPQLGCGNRSYQETLDYLQAYTGGVSASLQLNIQATNSHALAPRWHLRGKALGRNVQRLCEILQEFLMAPRFDDRRRIRELLEKRYTDLQTSLPTRALDYAMSRANAPLSEPLYISERLYGLSFFRKLRELVLRYEEREEAFLEKMAAIGQAMAGHGGLHLITCCDAPTMVRLQEQEWFGLCAIPEQPFRPWESVRGDSATRRSEGYAISSSVSFTAASMPTAAYATADAPRLSLLAQLMNDTVLHRALREQGGAYGGGASSNSMAALFSFYSYKDPNLFSTLRTYELACAFIESGSFDERALEEAKLGVLQDMDSPIAPGSRAEVAYSWHQAGKTQAMRQHFRDRLMAATKEEITALIPQYFPAGWSRNSFVAFAGKELFDKEQPLLAAHGAPLDLRSLIEEETLPERRTEVIC